MIRIIFIIIVAAIAVLLLTRKGREAAVGICAAALGQDAKKKGEQRKDFRHAG